MHIINKPHSRADIVFKSPRSGEVHVENVKTYGKAWGHFLKCLGWASSITDGKGKTTYVNTTSLIKHMAETWANRPSDGPGGLKTISARKKIIPSIIKSEKKSSWPWKKSALTNDRMAWVYDDIVALGGNPKHLPFNLFKDGKREDFTPELHFDQNQAKLITWDVGVYQLLENYLRQAIKEKVADKVNKEETIIRIYQSLGNLEFQNGLPSQEQVKEVIETRYQQAWQATIGAVQTEKTR